MKYVNAFNINVSGTECFITFLQNVPKGETVVTEETEGIVMSERSARQLYTALAAVYSKIDHDRSVPNDPKNEGKVKLS